MPNGAGNQAACGSPDTQLPLAGQPPARVTQIEPDTPQRLRCPARWCRLQRGEARRLNLSECTGVNLVTLHALKSSQKQHSKYLSHACGRGD